MSAYGILSVVLVFSTMIILHELGHLITAKRAGIRVSEFAVGFGPLIFYKRYKGTRYSLRLLPLGGFNNINLERKRTAKYFFAAKSLKDRLIILAAGSFMNLFSAWVALVIMVSIYGISYPIPVIESTVEGYPAAEVFQPGDRIISIDGKPIEELNDFGSNHIFETDKFSVVFSRNGVEKTAKIEKPAKSKLGLTYESELRPATLWQSIKQGTYGYKNILTVTYKGLAMIFSQEIKPTEALSGPVGISTVIYKVSEREGAAGVLVLFAILSINLGFMNLLPIPGLDGGHIVLQIADETCKKILGHQIPEKHLTVISYAGIAVIICIMALGLYADALRLSK